MAITLTPPPPHLSTWFMYDPFVRVAEKRAFSAVSGEGVKLEQGVTHIAARLVVVVKL